jgi:hypothetical protein
MNPVVTMADVLQGRVLLFHQPVPQQVGRLPQMRPAQSGGINTVNERATKAEGAKADVVKGRARPGRQSLKTAVAGASAPLPA